MKIVIDIPEKTYEQLKFLNEQGFGTAIDEAVANGTPLPKGHGRLIDADALDITTITTDDYSGNEILDVILKEDIDDAPTVFESSNLTNGDMILALNETAQVYGIDLDVMNKKFIKVCVDGVRVQFFDLNWWNAPYKKEIEE